MARNVLKQLADKYGVDHAVKMMNVPDDVKYEEPLQPPTIAGGLISLDPTDYLLGAPISRLGKLNKLAQFAAPMNKQAGSIDPELAQWIAYGAAVPAVGYGLGKLYSSRY